jgi:Ribbon-helix-helix protein, copG family
MKAIKGGARPGAGRKPTGKGQLVGVRIQSDDLATIDAWAADHGCTRSEAVRRLARLGLLADKKDG